jgi:hypothetical protein
VLAKIAAMPEPYRATGERLHALILCSAPVLQPATWYGMPAYAKDGRDHLLALEHRCETTWVAFTC